MNPEKPPHFSMLRDFHVADFFTLCNAFSGTGAILASMKFLVSGDGLWLYVAFVLLPCALVFDVLDGRIARWRHEQSPLGQELDSLADCVSFGVAPAVLAFALGMRASLDALVLVYFVACGISRLARYNATAAELSDDDGKVRYFEGAPIPSSLLLVLALFVLMREGMVGDSLPFGAISIWRFTLHPLVLMYLVSGSAMISKTLKVPKP